MKIGQGKYSCKNKQYIIGVMGFTFVIPLLGFLGKHFIYLTPARYALFGKLFIFSAVELRLFLTVVKQSLNLEFTAKEIFH